MPAPARPYYPTLKKREAAAFQAARHKAALTQPEAAEALGVPLGTLQGWEGGRRRIPDRFRLLAVKRWGGDRAELLADVCPHCGQRLP